METVAITVLLDSSAQTLCTRTRVPQAPTPPEVQLSALCAPQVALAQAQQPLPVQVLPNTLSWERIRATPAHQASSVLQLLSHPSLVYRVPIQ
jgi:hypothetical protein